MTTLIYWFRNDLRLADNPQLLRACSQAVSLVMVYCHGETPAPTTRWGFPRVGVHRARVLRDTLDALANALALRGQSLLELYGPPHVALPLLARAVGATSILYEEIAAPEEQAEVLALSAAGLPVHTLWQSSLLDLADLPFAPANLPPLFTGFRQAVERAGCSPRAPLPVPASFPSPPAALQEGLGWQRALGDILVGSTGNTGRATPAGQPEPPVQPAAQPGADARSSFPFHKIAFAGGEAAASAHLADYFAGELAHTYKATRNGLTGTAYSSKFSPWLASGAMSARTAFAALKQYEHQHGANDGTYWLWFELLWRDYFRLLHLQQGRTLYFERGLAAPGAQLAPCKHTAAALARWCQGSTGEPLVDAGMRELAATGYLSNRLRQVVASYLIHDLACDWRAGAAWFESQLVDYDVYSNQGNWLYIAGRGTDPRGGRRFNPKKQAQDHDPAGIYQRLWAA